MPCIVALCHFCEFHGPSLMMVTQSVPDTLNSHNKDIVITERENKPLGCSELFQESSKYSEVTKQPSVHAGCEGCWSFGGDPVNKFLVSQDKDTKRSFVSSQEVVNQQIAGLVRHAVIRSISCEICPGREGPIIFSDPSVSAVLSNNFLLKDSKARGFQRYYSVIVISREREHLVANSPNLTESIKQLVIDPLKQKTSEKFEADNKSYGDLREKCEVLRDSLKKSRYRRGSSRPARNLRELTDDPHVFNSIHSAFVKIITSMELRLKETVLSGQPMKSSVIFSRTSLPLLLDVLAQVGPSSFKVILYYLLSGKRLQVRSSLRQLARRVAEGLCILLPNNLRANSCFANLVVASQQVEEEESPQLRVEEKAQQSSPLQFKFLPPGCCCSIHVDNCSACMKPFQVVSSFVSKICKIFSNINLPATIQEMSVRSFSEKILLHSRVYQKLKTATEKRSFLSQNGFTSTDEEILNFFRMFS